MKRTFIIIKKKKQMENILNPSCFPDKPKLHKSYIHTSLLSSHLKSHQTITKYKNISSNQPRKLKKSSPFSSS